MTPDLEKADLQRGYHPALRTGAGSSPAEDDGAGRPGVLHLQRAGSGQRQEGRGEDARSPENAGGIFMRWPWRRRMAIEPRRAIGYRVLELEMPKGLLL